MQNHLTASATPLQPSERQPLLDALRGFALFGVLLANLSSFAYPINTWNNQWIESVTDILISTKFITLLTILFGAGFYYQWRRLQERQVNFKVFYLKRMFWLFVIGSLHAHLLWFGDILRIYAMSGALLLLFPLLKEKAVLRWAIIFVSPLTAIAFILQEITPYLTEYYPTGDEMMRAFTHGSYSDVLTMNWAIDPIRHFLKDSVLTLVSVLGKMLIGVWLARKGFFHFPSQFKRTQRVWLWSGLTIGTASSIVYWALHSGRFSIDTPLMLWIPFVVAGGLVLHGLLYLMLFVRWFDGAGNSQLSQLLQYTGRMALTNYLIQTVAGIVVFYGIGFGLAGKVTTIYMLVYGVVFFVGQMLFSNWWLKRFGIGPVESVWRKLTYRSVATERLTRSVHE